MNQLTIISILIFTTSCFTSVGQRKSNLPAHDINCSNHNQYYEKANQLLEINDRDSLFEGYLILNRLYYFDSIKYSEEFLKPRYQKIETINLDNIKTNIIGEWNFEWSGDAWATTATYKKKKEKIIFTSSEAAFFKSDTLVRKTPYSITNEYSFFLKEFSFQVYFHDDKTANNIHFKTSGADYIAHLAFSRDNKALYLKPPFYCFDCGAEIYMKASASGYRLDP